MGKYEIAGTTFELKPLFDYCKKSYAEFSAPDRATAEFTVTSTMELLKKERELFGFSENAPDPYVEDIFFERAVCGYILDKKNGTLFHGSVIEYNGEGYAFTARSGTGKSTHSRLWRELLGDRVKMVNDDKPIVRIVNGVPMVYGTPWKGKHRLGGIKGVPLKAVCRIVQAKENEIREVPIKEFLPTFFIQCYRPENREGSEKFLDFLDGLLKTVKLYELKCNISEEAAKLSFTTMTGDKI